MFELQVFKGDKKQKTLRNRGQLALQEAGHRIGKWICYAVPFEGVR